MIYFAYGSNMDPVQMLRRCPGHRVLGRAFLLDYALCFPRRSPVRQCATAGITRAIGEGVWGVLYALDAGDQTRLHVAEGYVRGGPAGLNRHTIEFVDVRSGGPEGATVTAYTYLARPDASGALPSEDYLGHLLRGAEHHRLPQDYVAKLRSIGTAAVVSAG
jgi:hypothetical protein